MYKVLGKAQGFNGRVLENYRDATSVKELATLCGMSLSSFKRQFAEEFGEPASRWMQKQMVGMIKYKLVDMDSPLLEIAEELHFPHSHNLINSVKESGMLAGKLEKADD